MNHFTYQGRRLDQISFPLGGIGTGSIGLSGTGRLIDWEIFGRPDKNSLNGFSFFAVKVEEDGKVIDSRVINSDLPPPYTGQPGKPENPYSNFGFGPARELLAGVPHFKQATFHGTYPQARIEFGDDTFPGQVALSAYNPFIPTDAFHSSLPLALFLPEMVNTGEKRRDYVVALCLNNPLRIGKKQNRHQKEDDLHCMVLSQDGGDEDSPRFGQLAMSVENSRAAYQESWYQGAWFDSLAIFWKDFTAIGDLKNRRYPPDQWPQAGGESVAVLTARITLEPGERGRIPFSIAWYFPNMENYWNPPQGREAKKACCEGPGCCEAENDKPVTWKHYYATQFEDALDVLRYVAAKRSWLHEETLRFMKVFYASSLPGDALEAVSANLSLLRSPTCLRLSDGSFYAFEGCHCDAGCCEGSCTHVWNYAYALPYLFPELERSMRELDYRYNLRPDTGEMPFRLQLPLGREPSAFRACADGQLGGVIKTYREWQICGDRQWLKQIWPAVKKSLEYAWHPQNPDRWDPEQKGYLDGRQHHTLDMELFGPNAWLSGMYLGALSAAKRMAKALGDDEAARLYGEIFSRGKKWVDENLFNGEYFEQKIDLGDRSLLDHSQDDSLIGKGLQEAYWNEEDQEIKYQIGEGSSIDQVLGQWHSDLVGLDDLFDRKKVRSALKAIHRYNYHESFRHVFNPCRVFCLNDEGGTQICAWPEGKRKPVVPAPYSEETMHGFEYQVGSHMILNGLEEEGLDVVRAVRQRYDGHRRNPWNEFECGSNYARSLATYALLLAYSGFRCELSRGHIEFRPRCGKRPCRFFWSLEGAWGEIVFTEERIIVDLGGGALTLHSLGLSGARRVRRVKKNGEAIAFGIEDETVFFDSPLEVTPHQALTLELGQSPDENNLS